MTDDVTAPLVNAPRDVGTFIASIGDAALPTITSVGVYALVALVAIALIRYLGRTA